MTVAMRPVVQRSVSNFQVVAPRRRRRGSCRCCAAVNFDGRPGAGLAVKALRPRRRTTSRQRITELCEHPSRRATSVTDAPAFSSSIPRRRRRSSSSGLPCGRMPRAYRVKHPMSITYAHINKSLVRFHYTEWSYNEHWGGDSLGTLLRQPNPLLNTEAVAIAEADPSCDFDFSLYVDQLTSPAYPPSEETGVYLYWGFADGSRGVYSETLQEMKSAELD